LGISRPPPDRSFSSEVDRIVIAGREESWRFLATPRAGNRQAAAGSRKQEKVEDFLKRLLGLRITEFVGESPGDLSVYGIAEGK
jgi:hypothetical protein